MSKAVSGPDGDPEQWANPAPTYDTLAPAYAEQFLHELEQKPFDRELLTAFRHGDGGPFRCRPSGLRPGVRAGSHRGLPGRPRRHRHRHRPFRRHGDPGSPLLPLADVLPGRHDVLDPARTAR